jgi:hypothetical protein
MSAAIPTNDREAIGRILKQITSAWTEGRFDDLNACFHERIVMVAPEFAARSAGRAPAVQSYRDFLAAATIQEYRESEPSIDC